MSDDDSDVLKWGEPPRSQRWHIFDGIKSLCGGWMYVPTDDEVDVDENNYREGKDCKECCRRAGFDVDGDES